MKINYYDVLGVDRSASEQQIRDRFRQLARSSHPDRYADEEKAEAERKFQTLTEAVNVLTNPARRKQHDSEISSGINKGADLASVGKAYLNKGVKAFKENDFRAAYENFDMAVKHNPNDGKGFHYLALAAVRIPAYTRQAVQAIEAAIQKEPMNGVYLKDAGLITKRAGLNAKAERYLEQAAKWDPENAEVQNALADLRQGRAESKDSGKGFTLFKKG